MARAQADTKVIATAIMQMYADGGWQTFGVFSNQGDCVSFVSTGGNNPPANLP